MFFGIFLLEIGLAAVIGQLHYLNLSFYTSFDLMFGALLLAHGLLKRGAPYRVGKLGTLMGILFLSFGVAYYYDIVAYTVASFFILLGLVVIAAALSRSKW